MDMCSVYTPRNFSNNFSKYYIISYISEERMINRKQLLNLIDRTLHDYNLHSKSAVNLIFGTIGVESNFGTYLRQKPKGNFDISVHALGICQLERQTYDWLNSKYRTKLLIYPLPYFFQELEYNLAYSILYCRLRYLAVKEALPHHEDVAGLAHYHKVYYNTIYGSAKEKDFIEKYIRNYPNVKD